MTKAERNVNQHTGNLPTAEIEFEQLNLSDEVSLTAAFSSDIELIKRGPRLGGDKDWRVIKEAIT